MPTTYFVNDNSHDIWVRDDSGELARTGPSDVVTAEEGSSYETRLKATNNVREVSEDDANAEKSGAKTDDSPNTAIGTIGTTLASTIADINRIAVSAPLQIVVGDDQAPYGPDTGVVTTKQQLVADGDEKTYEQFASGEPRPDSDPAHQEGDGTIVDPARGDVAVGAHGGPTSAEVHNEQVAARETVEEFAQSLTEGDGGEDKQPVEGNEAKTSTTRAKRSRAKRRASNPKSDSGDES